MSVSANNPYGMVAYSDGSFRRGNAGWGVHAYTYDAGALASANGEKQLPTTEGYQTVELNATCAVVEYINAYGSIKDSTATNNVAELQGVTHALNIARDKDVQKLLILTDSEYVQKNLFRSVPKWIKNDWIKPDGAPVANKKYWQELVGIKDRWIEEGRNLEVRWVKGHAGNRGNEAADRNALLATAGNPTSVAPQVTAKAPPKEKIKVSTSSALILRSRLLFDARAGSSTKVGDHHYYCMYSLGRSHSYGHKPQDGIIEKINKTDIILGRKLSEASFAILRTKKADDYIEELLSNHRSDHPAVNNQPAVLRLDNVLSPNMRLRYMEMGNNGFAKLHRNTATMDANDTLISKSLTPARQAYEAIKLFGVLKTQLDEYCNNNLGEYVHQVDITDAIYKTTKDAKNKTTTKLIETITNNTPFITVPCVINGVATKLKLVLGLDIPVRNTLAKVSELAPTVKVLVVADSPLSYSFSTIIDAAEETLLTTCPYTQFVLKK